MKPDVAAFTYDERPMVHLKPFIRWIWLGAALMALGGFVTALDRRFRNHKNAEARPA